MKIYNLPSPIRKVNFGYNKQYHKEIEEYLTTRTKDKVIAQSILEGDKFCLSIEDKITEMEKDKRKLATTGFKDLCEILETTKKELALICDYYFPKIKYSEKTLAELQEEIDQEDNALKQAWRAEIQEAIGSLGNFSQETTDKIDTQKESIEKTTQEETKPTQEDIKKTTDEIRAQAIDEHESKKSADILDIFIPSVNSPSGFIDVVGMDDVKEKFQEEILQYIKDPKLRQLDLLEYGIRAPRGFLFYGPPGCGKTFITQALAQESKLPMFKLDVGKIGSKYINESSTRIQAVFEFLRKYTQKSGKPVILFMDEVDSLAIDRIKFQNSSTENMKVTTTLLKLVEQARDDDIIVIAATNQVDILDSAFKARFDSQIYFGLPDEKQIKALLKDSLMKRMKGEALANDEESINKLINDLKGYSNRSITFIIDEASKIAKKDGRKDISIEHVQKAIKVCDFEKVKEEDYLKNSKKKQKKLGFGENN